MTLRRARLAWRKSVVTATMMLAVAVTGCSRRDAATETPGEPAVSASLGGEQVYLKYCAQCHMEDGSGVPNFQPALRGSPIVTGDPARLEAVIRAGSAALGERGGEWQAPMPPFGQLSDAEVKATMAYVREKFSAPAPQDRP